MVASYIALEQAVVSLDHMYGSVYLEHSESQHTTSAESHYQVAQKRTNGACDFHRFQRLVHGCGCKRLTHCIAGFLGWRGTMYVYSWAAGMHLCLNAVLPFDICTSLSYVEGTIYRSQSTRS